MPDSSVLTILGYPHQADGSGYYRFYLPYQQLARGSFHRVLLPEPGVKFTPNDEQIEEIDVLVGQRFAGPDAVLLWSRWKGKTKLVYEIDDDVLHPDTWSGLAVWFEDLWRDSCIECLRMSDLVTCSTGPLAEQMRQYNPNVVVIPNHVDADALYVTRPKRDRLVVGWSGGMSHLRDWTEVADPIRDVLTAYPDVDMHFLGIDYSPILKIGRPTRFTTWKPDVWSFFKANDFDIGLAPLSDTVFNHSKSHIRALEYMALGIPVLASDCPAYRDLVVDGVTGFLVGTSEEWAARLRDLINDEAMRTEMGAKGRDVARGWTVQQGWTRWAKAYEEVAEWQG